LEPGVHLGHFTVRLRVGVGGMGEVYRALDDRLEREVAIKVLPAGVASDAAHLARFEREAKALARLSHPAILSIHEFAEAGDIAYVVTEPLDGQTLQERLGQGPLPWCDAVEIGATVADGLAVAHGHGVGHRDIKPSNVFLTDHGEVKILDFGLARLQVVERPDSAEATEPSTLTQAGGVLGTPGYMSPEQVRGGPVDGRSDIFSFGTMLYEMLTGCSPFRRDTPADTLAAILSDEPPAISLSGVGVDADLNRLLRRCLDKSPARRFQSASDLAHTLRSLLESTPSDGTVSVLADSCPFVAVLPFANLTADPEQEYFCEGMAEELINGLAQVSGLRVVARTSAFSFKGRQADMREIGERLNVSAVVEGSVRRAGNQLRINAQLIDARTGLHLWSQRFDRQLEDVFAIQDEISLAVVDQLEVELLGSEDPRLDALAARLGQPARRSL
jgi:serine/threonine protein kinase